MLFRSHADLLQIFGEKGTQYDGQNKIQPSEIYKRLVAFIGNYTKQSEQYGTGMEVLRSLTGAIGLEERLLSLEDNIRFLEELLAESRVIDKAGNNAVSVQSLGDWAVLERSNVYVIGLALKDMQGNNTQSPVLFDEEMTDFLGDGYKPTIKNEAERREKNLYRTIRTFNDGHILFGYSSYDTVGFCDSNPSNFFRRMMELKNTDNTSLLEFVYGNPLSGTASSVVPVFKDKDDYGVTRKTSNSSMEVLLDCPKKYAYSRLLHIPESEFTEKDFGQWLNAAARGNFFHCMVEHYVGEKFIRPADEKYESDIDESFVRNIAVDIEAKYLVMYPVAFDQLADRETEDMITVSIAYLRRLLEEYMDDSAHPGSFWRGLAVEQKFVDAIYPVDGLDGTHYEFSFNGYVDRIDYRIDCAVKKVFLRIIDYKTGRKDRKQKEKNLGKLVQYAVYEKALMETGKVIDSDNALVNFLGYVKSEICRLEADPSLLSWDYEFACFQYVFPMEKSDPDPLAVWPDDLEGMNLDRLKAILAIIQDEKMYPDRKDLYNQLETLAARYPGDASGLLELREAMGGKNGRQLMSDNETSNCKYCSYEYLCEHKKAGDF